MLFEQKRVLLPLYRNKEHHTLQADKTTTMKDGLFTMGCITIRHDSVYIATLWIFCILEESGVGIHKKNKAQVEPKSAQVFSCLH